MRRRLLGIVLPAVVLLGAPAAAAKELTGGEVCGSGGCSAIGTPRIELIEGGPPTSGPTAGEPFVRMRFRVGTPAHSEPVRMLFLPRSGLVLADDGTTWMRPTALAAMRSLARRVSAFPASAMPASAPLARPLAAASRPSRDDGSNAWWVVTAAALVALAGGTSIARRRRGHSRARAAGVTG